MLNVTKLSPILKRTAFLMYMLNIIKLNKAKLHHYYLHPRGKYRQHKGECPFKRDLMSINGMWFNQTELNLFAFIVCREKVSRLLQKKFKIILISKTKTNNVKLGMQIGIYYFL